MRIGISLSAPIMDQRLLSWGSRPSVSAITRPRPASGMMVVGGQPRTLPRLWLFTDHLRLPDPRASVAGLPRGKAGVVLRHDHDPARAALGRDLARICRARRLLLVVAGDARLAAALKAGVHLRGGRWPGPIRPQGVATSSAHSIQDMIRARRAGAGLVFLSPAFPTASHAGAPGLGPLRWAAMARYAAPLPLAALGGVDGGSVKRLPSKLLRAVGAIGALSAG